VSSMSAVGRHIVISGGSRGLGKALVASLLNAGYRVSSFSRSASTFTEGLAGCDRFFFECADLADSGSVGRFLQASEKRFGLPYGLINCAALAADGILATMPEESIRQLVAVNVEGTIRFTRLMLRRMLMSRMGAVILNISSISSIRGFSGMSAYAFTKGGMDAFTRALAREVGRQNIRVNSIAPGYYDTDMSKSLSEQHKQQILRRTPLGRLGQPEDVVGSVLFLLSDAASFITGQTLVIDGGSTI
jgi:3-oxoacyl-[acyl-carrier protein] reductase